MTDTFAEHSKRWFGLAAQMLNWRPSDFWESTPIELAYSLQDPAASGALAGPSREQICKLMERDSNG